MSGRSLGSAEMAGAASRTQAAVRMSVMNGFTVWQCGGRPDGCKDANWTDRNRGGSARGLRMLHFAIPARAFVLTRMCIESRPLTERYRSGHNGTDSKSVEGITSLRGFESHPLRHSKAPFGAFCVFSSAKPLPITNSTNSVTCMRV